ncbi:MAG: hypothetical protein J5I98_06840 [Phaeodactylibacter sp.]|nr:hypothetical protein [Phaeodactylibacter sp.]
MTSLEGKLSNAQLELLRLFAEDLEEEDLKYLKQVLLRFRAERLMDRADEIWEEKGWTADDAKRLLETKMRVPYRRQP